MKAASDVYSPIAGEVIEGNGELEDRPELVNQDPYGDGWIMKIRPTDAADTGSLLDAEQYSATLEE